MPAEPAVGWTRTMLALGLSGISMSVATPGGGDTPPVLGPAPAAASRPAADLFQFPLPAMAPHCLGFGSQWRYCNGTPLRQCPNGAVWLHILRP